MKKIGLFSFNVKIVSRLKLVSVVKVAAYISRSMLYDVHKCATYDFTHKTDLLYSQRFLTLLAPPEFHNQEILWNAAERAENRYDSRTGRVLVGALPRELPLKEYIWIIKEYVDIAILPLGMIADVAIHSGHREDDLHIEVGHDEVPAHNPHMHILVTDRPVNRDGFCAKKNRGWIKREILTGWRKQWELVLNRAYERNGLEIEVSCDSLEVQDIKREPTIHLGRVALEIKQRGEQSDRVRENLEILARNEARKEKERQHQLELKQALEFELSL